MSTGLGMLIILGLILALEIWALVNKKPNDTISETFWRINKHPIVPFLCGVICGHLFW